MTAGAALVGVSACGDDGPDPQQLTAQALIPLARTALADETTARGLAATDATYAAALTVVADQRGAHAIALREEITRLHRDTASQLDTPASSTATSAPGGGVPTAGMSVDRLREQLRASARQARDTAVAHSGYPAGLAGAVSASVTSMIEVQLS